MNRQNSIRRYLVTSASVVGWLIAALLEVNAAYADESELTLTRRSPADLSQWVEVEIVEDVDARQLSADSGQVTDHYYQQVFAFPSLPKKYSDRAIQVDRSRGFLLRASGTINLPAGDHLLLLRSMNGASLAIDGKVVATTRFISPNTDGHEAVPDIPQARAAGMRLLPVGHAEKTVQVHSDGMPQRIVMRAFVGGPKLRPEIGELSVSIRTKDGFDVLSPRSESMFTLTPQAWQQFVVGFRKSIAEENARQRRVVGEQESEYWRWRHQLLKKQWASSSQSDQSGTSAMPSADIGCASPLDKPLSRLADQASRRKLDDLAFLRRVALDLVGRVPTRAEITWYLSRQPSVRREQVVDRLLQDDGWADHWTAYWQDVLAENPGILKPKINNTGPFRYWIHESFVDNKPIDRFVTELILMRGSTYFGGPAGFSLATQNDVPMAAKAHVLGQAFLAVDMKCARCHDAPFQDIKQQDLFSVAAMLRQSPIQLPETSSIPLPPEERSSLGVEVTLEPGSVVTPEWPFEQRVGTLLEIPEGVVRDKASLRENLAATITYGASERFAQVVANRLWHRYMGWGLVEPVHDWSYPDTHYPELLELLARELVFSGFDMKHLARVIVLSKAYDQPASENAPQRLAPQQRRMTAEQLVDSMFLVAGKRFKSEPLTLDLDGRRSHTAFLNLGTPTRAWQFTSLSNERDRPALAMPRAQSIVDVLEVFGWRSARQNPLTERPAEPTVHQPAILANGTASRRVWALSDDSQLTQLCLDCQSPSHLAEELYLRFYTRYPQADELQWMRSVLSPGFSSREKQVSADDQQQSTQQFEHAVSWSNHLSARATEIKLELERRTREGDPASVRLQADWRQRAEDVIWALLNGPEFVMKP